MADQTLILSVDEAAKLLQPIDEYGWKDSRADRRTSRGRL